jgi:hypothetical protein
MNRGSFPREMQMVRYVLAAWMRAAKRTTQYTRFFGLM